MHVFNTVGSVHVFNVADVIDYDIVGAIQLSVSFCTGTGIIIRFNTTEQRNAEYYRLDTAVQKFNEAS